MTCNDAARLLYERRYAALTENTVRIREIDNERFAHVEESPTCRCWTKAILAADAQRKVA